MVTARARSEASSPPSPAGPRRWLLFVHQLPPTPSNLRVRTWRRLQALGAVALKQAVYALPDSAEAREDFEWLKVEVQGAGGEASVFAADQLDTAADLALVEEFRRSRQAAYAELAADLQRLLKVGPLAPKRRSPRRRDELSRFRQRLAAIERLDFFSSAGRDRVITLLAQIEGAARPDSGSAGTGREDDSQASERYRNRVWVTRPVPGVDRMGSAWLIRRFIDPAARFGFVTDPKAAAPDAIPFDMFGVEFSHQGSRCTFETLCARFAIRQPAVERLAAIVHDLDLKDDRFGAPEAATLGAAIAGLQLAFADDAALLEQGITLFEALFRSFEQPGRSPRPRAVARRRLKTPRSR